MKLTENNYRSWKYELTNYCNWIGDRDPRWKDEKAFKYLIGFIVSQNVSSLKDLLENNTDISGFLIYLNKLNLSKSNSKQFVNVINKFVDWFSQKEGLLTSRFSFDNYIDSHYNPKMLYLIYLHGNKWETWRKYATAWIAQKEIGVERYNYPILSGFFSYLIQRELHDVNCFFSMRNILDDYRHYVTNNKYKHISIEQYLTLTSKFLDWVKNNQLKKPGLKTPIFFPENRRDENFYWLVCELNEDWEQWRTLAKNWVNQASSDSVVKRNIYTLNQLFLFLSKKNLVTPELFFKSPPEIDQELNDFITNKSKSKTNALKIVSKAKTFLGHVSKKLNKELPFDSLRNSGSYKVVLEIKDELNGYGDSGASWLKFTKSWIEILKKSSKEKYVQRKSKFLLKFFRFLSGDFQSIDSFFRSNLNKKDLENCLFGASPKTRYELEQLYTISDFLCWLVLQFPQKNYSNSFFYNRSHSGRLDMSFQWLVNDRGFKWESWQKLGKKWLSKQKGDLEEKILCLNTVFDFLISRDCFSPSKLLDTQNSFFDFSSFIEKNRKNFKESKFFIISHFFDWVISHEEYCMYRNPFFYPTYIKTSRDLTFEFLPKKFGPQWVNWQSIAISWVKNEKEQNIQRNKVKILIKFFEFLKSKKLTTVKELLTSGVQKHELEEHYFKGIKKASYRIQDLHKMSDFIDWVKNREKLNSLGNPLFYPRYNTKTKDKKFWWVVRENGNLWSNWRECCEDYLKWVEKNEKLKARPNVLMNSINSFLSFLVKEKITSPRALLKEKRISIKVREEIAEKYFCEITEFLVWVYRIQEPCSSELPFLYFDKQKLRNAKNYAWLDYLGEKWSSWKSLIKQWHFLKINKPEKVERGIVNFIFFLHDHDLYQVESIFETSIDYPFKFRNYVNQTYLYRKQLYEVSDFFDWIIENDDRFTNNKNIFYFPKYSLTGSNPQLIKSIKYIHGREWEEWYTLFNTWLENNIFGRHKSSSLNILLEFLLRNKLKNPMDIFKGTHNFNELFSMIFNSNTSDKHKDSVRYVISDFLDWVLKSHYKNFKLKNPLYYPRKVFLNFNVFENGKPIAVYGEEWLEWQELAIKWLRLIKKREGKVYCKRNKETSLRILLNFFYHLGYSSPQHFFTSNVRIADLLGYLKNRNSTLSKNKSYIISDFLCWVSDVYPSKKFINPFYRTRKGKIEFIKDGTFNCWVNRHNKLCGEQWEEWRQLANQWLNLSVGGYATKVDALNNFFEKILTTNKHFAKLEYFFMNLDSQVSHMSKEFSNSKFNIISHFFDWLIELKFREDDDQGSVHYVFSNPLNKKVQKRTLFETVKSPLPIKYINDLKEILCPKEGRYFTDFTWAMKEFKVCWYNVDKSLIDKNDPNCVWRNIGGEYQLWSPVRAVLLLLKLYLPLRTYQVRFLDSGEADYWRYENGSFVVNTKHSFVEKGRKKGLFYNGGKSPLDGQDQVLLYVTTNKTHDKNLSYEDNGYLIPRNHKRVMYWCEQLRDWQEKYNPINKPIPCSDLEEKHFGSVKHAKVKEQMGTFCFLFRCPEAQKLKDRERPINYGQITNAWVKLLYKLQENIYERGEVLGNGEKIYLTEKNNPDKALYTLHSLRVSLITAYVSSDIPLPIIAKYVGHSRLLMSIYYAKFSSQQVNEKFEECEENLVNNSKDLKSFIYENELKQIEESTAFLDRDAIGAMLQTKYPASWCNKPLGICLAGGNMTEGADSSIPGCWNGGPIIEAYKQKVVHAEVPHGYGNCVRCRWFITDITYLNSLTAHLNYLSFQAHKYLKESEIIEAQINKLKDEKYQARISSNKFFKGEELKIQEQRFEDYSKNADEFLLDYLSTLRIITRISTIEEARQKSDEKQKLISVGTEQDLKLNFKFLETSSDLLHYILICDDAELYPDIKDRLNNNTSIIYERSQLLDSFLSEAKGNSKPVFMTLPKEMQLKVGNAFIRKMAKQFDADRLMQYEHLATYLEKKHFLSDISILDNGIQELRQIQNNFSSPINLGELKKNIEVKSE